MDGTSIRILGSTNWDASKPSGLVERLAPLGPLPVVTSPLRRCQQTAAPLAAHWQVEVVIEPMVAEIPSPPGVPMERACRLASPGDGRDVGGAGRPLDRLSR